MKVLLTFVGFHDPFYPSRVDGQELKGPILYFLGIRRFDRVYLFSAGNTMEIARRTAAAVAEMVPETEARIIPMDIDDSIDYASIMRAIRSAFHRVSLECKGAQYAISTSSGTPQMHACWLILASSGEIPATMLQTRPPQFVTTDRPAVEEVDLSVIAPRELAMQSMPASAAQFARTPFPVLIQGETGTGKELVARYIHRLSGLPADADYARSVDNRAVSRLSHCAAARFEIE